MRPCSPYPSPAECVFCAHVVPLHEDLNIRNAQIDDCDQLGLITVSASHAAFIGSIPEASVDFSWTPEHSASNWRKSFAENTDRGQVLRVGVSGGRVLGFAWSVPWADTAGYDASIRGLYVLPTRHGQGIGRALLMDAVRFLQRGGASSLEIGCVKENPSCDFYRHLGGIEIGTRPVTVDRHETHEILFGWADLSQLMQ